MGIIEVKDGFYIEYDLQDDGCWNVKNKSVQDNGFITCSVKFENKKYNSLIRLVYDIHSDEKCKDGVRIKRSCNNKYCVHPNHLFEYEIGDWRSKLVGNRYGKIVIVEYKGSKDEVNKKVSCVCDCGKSVTLNIGNLKTNPHVLKSCGCVRNEKITNLNKTHQLSNTKLYRVLAGAKSRCYYKGNGKYNNYGGRGIKVCDEWLNDYLSFFEWANENGYREGLSLDRINVNGNYEPDNCRWITMSKQASNKQNSIVVDYEGESYCLHELMVKLNRRSDYGFIRKCIVNYGFTIQESLGIKSRTDKSIIKFKYRLLRNSIINSDINIESLSKILSIGEITLRNVYLKNSKFLEMLNYYKIEVTK